MGIKGGRVDVQRFIYWNFLKCFWNEQLGRETSVVTNFDWYSPSNAQRFSEAEVRAIVDANGMAERFFHAEEACYSGPMGTAGVATAGLLTGFKIKESRATAPPAWPADLPAKWDRTVEMLVLGVEQPPHPGGVPGQDEEALERNVAGPVREVRIADDRQQ